MALYIYSSINHYKFDVLVQNGSLLSAAGFSFDTQHVWGQTPLCTGDVIVYFRQTPLLPVIIETPHATKKLYSRDKKRSRNHKNIFIIWFYFL